MPKATDINKALGQSSLFAGFTIDTNTFAIITLEKGQSVPCTHNGEAALALIVSGLVRVYDSQNCSVILSTLKPGDCLGISNIFSGMQLSTLPRCVRRTKVALLTRCDFFAMLRADPGLYEQYAILCNQKISYLTEKLAMLTTPLCRERIASYLLQHASANNLVCLECSKETLASVLGVSRANLYRELKLMSQNGIITVNGRKICIIKPEELHR